MCSRTPAEYVADMYRLYTDCDRVEWMENGRTIELNAERAIDPNEWLVSDTASFPCIKAYRTYREFEDASLEIFVSRPKNSTRYYALGECDENGNLLFISEKGDTKLNWKTVDMLLKTSSQHCHRPIVCKIDWK